jgi:hypothetical protein
MDELLSGLHHWTAYRETIRRTVHCAYVEPALALIDPLLPEEGIDWFREHGPPERVVLTNRHHLRHSARFAEAFGCTVHCHEAGLWDLHDAPVRVEGFRFGDELAPGIVAHEVGALCREETALHIATGSGALAVADGVIRDEDGDLAFVSDFLLGDDPASVKHGLAAAYRRLTETLEFDVLLLAHGDPWVGGGRAALRAFAEQAAPARD